MPLHEHATMWRQPVLDGVAFARATFIQHAFPRHTHDYFAIGVIEVGTQQFALGRERYVTPTGGLFIVNPGEVHTGEAATRAGFTYRSLYPTHTMLATIAQEIAERPQPLPEFSTPVIHDPDLARLLLHTHQTLELPISTLEAESRLRSALAQLVRRHAPSHPTPRPLGYERDDVAQARRYLDEHYQDAISLQQLAAVARLSPYYLNRVFRKDVGMPPYAYLENRRIQQAQRLIMAGQPLADIAFATGFSSQSHFTTSFKRYLGVPPGYYAQARGQLPATSISAKG